MVQNLDSNKTNAWTDKQTLPKAKFQDAGKYSLKNDAMQMTNKMVY